MSETSKTSEARSTPVLRVYFAFRSPYSRLGLHKVARAGLAARLPTTLIPFTAPAGGAAFLDPTGSPPKLGYYAEDAPRMTARMGLPFALPNPFEVDYAPANRAFRAARAAGRALPFALAVSDARWGEGRDVSDEGVLADCAVAAGVPEGTDLAAEPGEAVRADRARLDEDGVFGVPFAVLTRGGQRERFWGQDRFDLLVEAFGGTDAAGPET